MAEDIETLASISETKTPSKYWATWIKKIYEVDPLKCRICGGKLKVKSFVLDYRELKAIHKKQTGQQWRAPPKITRVTKQKQK